jgi:hypothetical protein
MFGLYVASMELYYELYKKTAATYPGEWGGENAIGQSRGGVGGSECDEEEGGEILVGSEAWDGLRMVGWISWRGKGGIS